MPRNIQKVTVDIKDARNMFDGVVYSGDAVTFSVEIEDSGAKADLSDIDTFLLIHKRPHMKAISTPGKLVSGNLVEFELGTSEIAIAGTVEAVVQLYDEVGRVTPMAFSYTVKADPTAQGLEVSTIDKTFIEIVLGEGPDVIQGAKEATAAAAGATAETNRVKAETEEVKNQTIEVMEAAETAVTDTKAATKAANDAAVTAAEKAGYAEEQGDKAKAEAEAAAAQKLEVAEVLGAGPVYSVNGQTGAVEGLATAAQLADKAEKAELTTLSVVKADKEYVDTHLSRIGSATPKGAYATVATLQSAIPTGDDNIYVVTEDGKWYYWNDVAWTSGGIYQSTVSSDFPATNIIKNGNFENGATDWLATGGSIATVDEELIYTVTSLSASARIDQSKDVAISGHKYYVRGDIFPKYATATFMQLGAGNTINFTVTPNQWNTLSAIVTPSANTRFRFYHSTSASYIAGDTVKFDNVMAVDLTATFGAGNEPTLEEFEDMLSGYVNNWFNGTVSPLVGAKKLYTQSTEQAQRLATTEEKVNQLTALSKITPLTSDPIEPPVGSMWFLVDYLEESHLSQTNLNSNFTLMSKPTRIGAQKFTATETINLSAIELNLKKNVTNTADIAIEVWESAALSNTAPATLLDAVTIKNADFDNTADFKWVKKRLTTQPKLTAGKVYWITFSVGTDGHASIGINLANLIPNAGFAISTNEGTSFTSTASTIGMKLYKVAVS